MRIARVLPLVFAAAALPIGPTPCAEEPASPRPDPQALPDLLKEEYRALEASRLPPPDAASFKERRDAIRSRHAKALGVEVERRGAPVTFKVVGKIAREGYEVRRITFESRPRLPVPALLYVPQASGPHPAVLSVHGHWQDAKAAPTVQLRNIFLARHGYVVLALDAIGAGERSYRDPVKGPITYHGRQLGYAVLPSGLTLAGLQVEDNRRAIDLLASLPEVDPSRIGVTGASGGGNQTFNLAVLDERVRAAAAVCFYGAYRGYLEGAHCACELAPGVLRHGEEGDVAGSIAPRSLLVIAAVRDQGAAFRIQDARRSIEVARKYYAAAGAHERLRFQEFDCGHDYNKEMREAMVAFFDRHLRGVDSGERVAEPPIVPEDLETLRCFGTEGPGADALTVPAIVLERSKDLIDAFRKAGAGWADPASREPLRRTLREEVFGGFPAAGGPACAMADLDHPARGPARVLVVLAGGGERYRREGPAHLPDDALRVEVFPRGTGATSWPGAAAVDCPDYVLAQGTAVLGRPVLGMWTLDALRAVDRIAARFPDARIGLYGEGAMGTVALLAGALSDRVAAVGTVDSLASYAFGARFDDRWPLALFAPGILRVGDLPQIAEAIPPRTLAAGSPRDGGGAIAGDDSSGPAEVIGKVIEGLGARRTGAAAETSPRAAWKITPLHTGLCFMGKHHVRGDPFTDEERVPFSLISFLLEGPGGDLAIVDFGPKDPAYFSESFRRYGLFRERAGDREHPDDVVQPEGNVLAHLERRKVPPARVNHIVFTHLHYDHVGGSRPPDPGLLRDFPGAVLHISKRGWDDNLARRADGWRWTSYVDFDVSQEILLRGKEGRARFADDEEVMPGLRTRYLGGHSVCSQAVLADTADGTAVIAGDVVYHYEYLEQGIIARLRTTAEEYARALERVVALVEETRGILVPVHDPKVLEAFLTRGDRWLSALRGESERAVRGYRARAGALRLLEEHRNKG